MIIIDFGKKAENILEHLEDYLSPKLAKKVFEILERMCEDTDEDGIEDEDETDLILTLDTDTILTVVCRMIGKDYKNYDYRIQSFPKEDPITLGEFVMEAMRAISIALNNEPTLPKDAPDQDRSRCIESAFKVGILSAAENHSEIPLRWLDRLVEDAIDEMENVFSPRD